MPSEIKRWNSLIHIFPISSQAKFSNSQFHFIVSNTYFRCKIYCAANWIKFHYTKKKSHYFHSISFWCLPTCLKDIVQERKIMPCTNATCQQREKEIIKWIGNRLAIAVRMFIYKYKNQTKRYLLLYQISPATFVFAVTVNLYALINGVERFVCKTLKTNWKYKRNIKEMEREEEKARNSKKNSLNTKHATLNLLFFVTMQNI